MEGVYISFHNLVKRRIEKFRNLYLFGEDSIRYDFLCALSQEFDLESSDILLEYAFPKTLYFQKTKDDKKEKRGRKDHKPELDLRVDSKGKLKQGLLAEFSFFKGAERAQTQDRSGRHGKLMNDIFRLALLKSQEKPEPEKPNINFLHYKCLLVCVSDAEMIQFGKKRKKTISIQKEYELTEEFLSKLSKTANDAIIKHIKEKSLELGITPMAKLIFHRQEEPNNGLPEWCIWIWEVSFK